MKLEFFIALRIAKPSSDNRPGVMVRIASIAVALSVAVMIIALAVIMGFKREITCKITGFAAHVEVIGTGGINAMALHPIIRSAETEQIIRSSSGFLSLAPYAVKGGIFRTESSMQGVMLKGVDTMYDWSFFADHIVDGVLPRVGDTVRTKDVLISRVAADALDVVVGDKIEMLFVEEGSSLRRDRFKVSGIYSSGMDEMDKAVAMTDIRNVQRLSGWDGEYVSGYEVRISDFSKVGDFAAALDESLLFNSSDNTSGLAVYSIKDIYPNVFDWLKAHDVNAAVIIVIMLVVALFNMASALLILVLERTRMIGTLKALGMNDRSIQKIFLYRAGFIMLKGLVWGNVTGLSVCFVQSVFHIVKLNSAGYMLAEVPIDVGVWWMAALNVGVVVAVMLLMTLPAYIISFVKPEESIRYN